MRCDECKFWETEDLPKELTSGICKRFPPSVGYNQFGVHCEGSPAFSFHPATVVDDWCGEFQAKAKGELSAT